MCSQDDTVKDARSLAPAEARCALSTVLNKIEVDLRRRQHWELSMVLEAIHSYRKLEGKWCTRALRIIFAP